MKKRRVLAIFLACFLSFSCFVPGFAASAVADDSTVARVVIPEDFVYTENVTLATGIAIPPGTAVFEVTITGTLDTFRNNIIATREKTVTYLGGTNYDHHDLKVVTWLEPEAPGTVYWKLEGTVVISWTDPIAGMTFERVIIPDKTYSFEAEDYLI